MNLDPEELVRLLVHEGIPIPWGRLDSERRLAVMAALERAAAVPEHYDAATRELARVARSRPTDPWM